MTSHPAARSPARFTVAKYLSSRHVAPTPPYPQAPGVIDEQLQQLGLQNPVVSPNQYLNTLKQLVQLAGFKDSGQFFATQIDMQAMAQQQGDGIGDGLAGWVLAHYRALQAGMPERVDVRFGSGMIVWGERASEFIEIQPEKIQ